MSDQIRVSVDGQHGVVASRIGGIRFVHAHDDIALVRVGVVVTS